MKKTLAALALAGSIALIGSAPAVAGTYPPIPPQAAVSDGTVGPGEQFTFRGRGPFEGQPLTIEVNPGNPPAASGANIAGGRSVASRINVVAEAQRIATKADAQGRFSVQITIQEAGTYFLTATSASGYTVGPVRVVVDPSFSSTGASRGNSGGGAALANTGRGTALANTGADSGLILWTIVGAGALAAGAASVVVVRRRAKTEAAA